MKKIVGILTVAALATSLFAEVNVGAWGRSGMDVISTSDFKSGSVVATPGWADGSRVGVSFGAADEDGNIGFNLNVDSNGGTIGIGDQAKIWANIGPLQVQFGKIQLDDLRGSIGDNGNRTEFCVAGEDAIFARMNPQNGMTLALRPVDGLFIGAAIDPNEDWGAAGTAIQGGIGYTIADVAQLKAQYIGKANTVGDVQVGVDVLALPVLVEVGVRVGGLADVKNKGTVNGTIGFAGAFDALSIKGHVICNFENKGSKVTDNLTAGCEVQAEYGLGVCDLGVNAGYKFAQGENSLGGELYAKKGFGNGYLFGGVADTFVIGGANSFKVPVGAEYWF